jgi:hypothetical protein
MQSSAIGSILGRVLGSIQSSRLEVCNRVQSEAYLRVSLEHAWECAWERAMKCFGIVERGVL